MQPHASTPGLDPTDTRAVRPPDEADPIVVRGSEDLVAAVPHLVGFAPEHSLVVVSMGLRGRRLRLGLVARFDLPQAGRRPRGSEGSAAAVATLVGQVVDVMSHDAPEQVVLLVYDDAPCGVLAPWQRLVDRLGKGFRSAGVTVLDALHVSGGRFRSYRCADASCCPSSGHPIDVTSSAVAAEFVARGSSPLANRAALEALVRPTDDQTCARVDAETSAVFTGIGSLWADESSPRWRAWQVDSLQLLHRVADRYLTGASGVDHQEAARLLAALCDAPVRDAAAMVFTSLGRGWQSEDEEGGAARAPRDWLEGTRAGELAQRVCAVDEQGGGRPLALPDRDRALERLWRDLAISCDGLRAAPPLTLLGMHAWSQGNGALALVAAERALSVDPEYRLAQLLDQTLAAGIRPRRHGPTAGV